jgi:hypothetical protein
MVLENKSYVPTLAVRPSEMSGLEFLPGASKDRMTPCFLLAPWANSNSLERTIERIERAFPNRNYFLDLDRDYQITNLESEPQRELAELLNPANNFRNWLDFVAEHERVWPCLQSRGQTTEMMRAQLAAFQDLGRPFCMRIVRDRFPSNFFEIVDAFAAAGTADFAILLEGGWTRDPLTLSLWFDGIISGNLSNLDASVPVIPSCTSIPKMFTEYNSTDPIAIEFNNRQLLAQIKGSTNRARLVYGDWGSTRPREISGHARRPHDRIDFPLDNAWIVVRNRDLDWDFNQAARKIIESEFWKGNLGVWGEEMISQTAVNLNLGINTPQKNVAARVNIHLHRQSFFGAGQVDPAQFDEDWQD